MRYRHPVSTRPRFSVPGVVSVGIALSLFFGIGCGDEPDGVDISVALNEGIGAQAEGRDADAEERFVEVVEASPGNRVALYNLGILRRDRGDSVGAIDAFTQLLEAQPGFGAARFQRAITKQQVGDLPGAIDDLRLVIEQEPNNSEAQILLDTLLGTTGEDPTAAP